MAGRSSPFSAFALARQCSQCLVRSVRTTRQPLTRYRPFSSLRDEDSEQLETAQVPLDTIAAAPEIDLATFQPSNSSSARPSAAPATTTTPAAPAPLDYKRAARIIPASPSYFTSRPLFTDDLLALQSLLRAHQLLPTLTPDAAPRATWKTLVQYRVAIGEEVPAAKYTRIIAILKRLNRIHPSLQPAGVRAALDAHRRDVDPLANRRKIAPVDGAGRAYGTGRRKAAKAQAWLVEGDGQVLVNGQTLAQAFERVHDRESAIWPLKATGRVGLYNVWATVHGGGKTGQAESITLAVARALMVHEPDLKPALRRAGVVRRDPRRVERKKPGKLKARKMPAWVKR